MIVTSVHVSFCLYLILMCDVGRRFYLPPLYAYTYYIRLMSIDPGKQYTIQQLIIILVKYEYTIIMLFCHPYHCHYYHPVPPSLCQLHTTNARHDNIQTVIHTYKI